MNGIGPIVCGEDRSVHTRQTFLYFGSLTLFLYLATPAGYLVDIQTSYMLKNQLGATAEQTSTFRLVTAIPVYLVFAFGLMRDAWNQNTIRLYSSDGDRRCALDRTARPALRFLEAQVLLAVVEGHFHAPSHGVPCDHDFRASLMAGRVERFLTTTSSQRLDGNHPQRPVRRGMHTGFDVVQACFFGTPVDTKRDATASARPAFARAKADVAHVCVADLWCPASAPVPQPNVFRPRLRASVSSSPRRIEPLKQGSSKSNRANPTASSDHRAAENRR